MHHLGKHRNAKMHGKLIRRVCETYAIQTTVSLRYGQLLHMLQVFENMTSTLMILHIFKLCARELTLKC